MEDVQEGFLDQHARERLKREQEVLEKERAKHQKKVESVNWLKIISKVKTYCNIKSYPRRKGIKLDEV